MEIVYGPVHSWRLKKSLGVDLICRKKVCSFDCPYCSLGETNKKTMERKTFTPTKNVKESLEKILPKVEADVMSFAGSGEPTLAKNLGDSIEAIREISNLPVAVLTNSSLMFRKGVREELKKSDIVIGSLDAPNPEIFKKVNDPHRDLDFRKMVEGIKTFSQEFSGKFSLEIMFIRQNRDCSDRIAEIARKIDPDEVQVNTPLRTSREVPLNPNEIEDISRSFEGMNTLKVYENADEKKANINIVGKQKMRNLKR